MCGVSVIFALTIVESGLDSKWTSFLYLADPHGKVLTNSNRSSLEAA